MPRERPLLAFFDYPDVFEDFYPHYGVSQREFATRWSASGNHAFIALLQREVGDVTWFSLSLAPEFDEARHEVTGCRVRFLRSSWLHRQLWRAFYLPRCAWRWRSAYPLYATVASYLATLSWPLLRTLLHDRPDFFFVQEYSNGRFDVLWLLSRVLRVPLIALHAGSQPERYLGRLIKRWTIPRTDCLIASGRREFELLTDRLRVPPARIRVILTPIDTEAYRPMNRFEACRAAGLDPTRRYLLFVGRLDDRVKRVSAQIRAFAALAANHPDTDLVIAGEGGDGPELRRLAQQTVPGRVHFAGWISRGERFAPLYNAAECLLLPSVSEGFPNVVGEAMACGTPVLASDVGGINELVVEGESGWLIPPCDDAALGARMAHVLENPDEAAAMRPRVRRLAEARVSPAVVAAELKRCFSADYRPDQRPRESEMVIAGTD